MRKFNTIAFLALAATLVFSCSKPVDSDCPKDRFCTTEFRMIGIGFTDKQGAPTAIQDQSVILVRTGDTIKSMSNAVVNTIPGAFIVVDDSYTEKLMEAGDDIKVTATSVATKQTKSTVIKVSGGRCACHIRKVSGAEKVAFD
ncbi:hypothetical protein [Pedobacter steynii]|uniref:Pilus formation protein N-terminal domain-containing protein n=1 Tax=Pedobacter steynii TaxID=430522 RepID=A0A1D7QKK0_9SPHI|nr:hypothetical protein [Pedobacter steynii]AOM79204.1 hypothetical protein BFS30_19750 [Pedobacter steynii]